MKALTILKYILLCASAVLIAMSLFFYQQTERFLLSATRTQGMVTGLVSKGSQSNINRKQLLFHAQVRYTDSQGQSQSFVSAIGHSHPEYTPGGTVPVLYLNNQPRSAILGEFTSIWYKALLSGGITLFFLILTLIVLYITPSARASR